MKRMGMVIGIAPERIAEYKRLHAAVWPGVLERIAASGIRNYTIYLREPENLLFASWEYHGNDLQADMAAIAADPETQRWWTFTDPCQIPLASRAPGEHWAAMEEVFHVD
ncbi:MAG: L-rhamnose mutarotase [Vitreoscilla sp.]